MAWFLLVVAGLVEVAWTYFLTASKGFTKPGPTVIFFALSIFSFLLLAQAVKTLPIGTAYAVWTGIGTVGAVIVGILFFNEPRDLSRLLCIALIIAGIAGLKILSPH